MDTQLLEVWAGASDRHHSRFRVYKYSFISTFYQIQFFLKSRQMTFLSRQVSRSTLVSYFHSRQVQYSVSSLIYELQM